MGSVLREKFSLYSIMNFMYCLLRLYQVHDRQVFNRQEIADRECCGPVRDMEGGFFFRSSTCGVSACAIKTILLSLLLPVFLIFRYILASLRL